MTDWYMGPVAQDPFCLLEPGSCFKFFQITFFIYVFSLVSATLILLCWPFFCTHEPSSVDPPEGLSIFSMLNVF